MHSSIRINAIFLVQLFSSGCAAANKAADLNHDGEVNNADLQLLIAEFGTSCDGGCKSDLNNDGKTDAADMLLLNQEWGFVNRTTFSTSSITTTKAVPFNLATHEHGDTIWNVNTDAPVLLDAVYYDQLARTAARIALGEEFNEGELTKVRVRKECYSTEMHTCCWG
jgi:hypothetical protein